MMQVPFNNLTTIISEFPSKFNKVYLNLGNDDTGHEAAGSIPETPQF